MGLDELNYAVQHAAMIATKAALNGKPLASIQYIPSQTATQYRGTFVTKVAVLNGSDTPPWDM